MIDAALLHLMMNTVPPIVSLMAVPTMLAGLIARSESLKRYALVLMVSVPILIFPVYFSGHAAVVRVGNMPGIPLERIGQHQESVQATWIASAVAGAVALIGLIASRGPRRMRAWHIAIAVVISLGADALLLYTAHLGGKIRHPEVRESSLR